MLEGKITKREIGHAVVRRASIGFAALLLIVAANALAVAYLSSERYIYTWDFSYYWEKFARLGELARSDVRSALAYSIWSIANEDYTALPVIPLVPFELLFGSGRTPYVLAIVNFALLPSAALMAWLVERSQERRDWVRFLICMLAVLCLHILWAPALRGLPDVLGVAIACVVLLSYVAKPPAEHRLLQLIGIGLLLCLLVLTRRWYLFWAVSFFPAAMVASAVDSRSWRSARATFAALTIVGVAFCVCLLLLAAPLIVRMATTDYAAAYAAYRPELARAGLVGQVVDQVGLAVLALSFLGLAWLCRQPSTRPLAILLAVQGPISLWLFGQVQGFLGVQHFYLLAPAMGIGVAAALAAVWTSKLATFWRTAAAASVLAAVAASSCAALSPVRVAAPPLLPRNHYPPLVRPDLAEIHRLMTALQRLKSQHVYVVSSSEVLNWGTLRTLCRLEGKGNCEHLAISADIDMRDGFPAQVLDADHVVLATPTQYHVRPEDQKVIGLVAQELREHRGIGASFQKLPSRFTLQSGVVVELYQRVRPVSAEDARALSEELIRSYPASRALFTPQADRSRR